MRKTKLIVAIFICFLTTFSFAQQNDLKRKLPVDPKVKIGKLDNGLEYYIRKNSKPEKRVEFRLVVKAGSMQETDGQVGLAHFTEHMAFNGSTHFPKNELVSYLQSIGMRFGGDLNAYTSFDETVYMLTVPTEDIEKLDKGFLVIQDWAANLTMEGKEIDAERGVIIEEWRTGKSADERMRKVWFPIVFTNSLYADRMPIGTYENLKSFKHDTLRKFYKDWYRPNLQAVIVVGDIDVDYVENKIKELFGSLQNPKNAPERISHSIGENKEILVARATDKEATTSQIMTVRKHKGFRPKTLEDYRVSLMHSLYNMMISERFNELQQDPQCPVLGAGSYYGDLVGDVDAFMGVAIAKENLMKEAFLLLLKEEERAKQHGFLDSELERVKEELLSRYEKNSNEADKTLSASFASQYVNHFLNESPIMGAKIAYNQAKKLIETITVEDINNIVKNWITDENYVVVVLGPEKEGLHILSEEEVREILKSDEYKKVEPFVDKYKPEPLVSKELTGSKVASKKDLPEINATEYTLANGIRIVIKVTDFKDDEILMMGQSYGGASLYSIKEYPSSQFAVPLVERSGLGEFDYIELEKKLKGKYVSVSPFIGQYSEGISGNSTPKDFETFLQLVYLYFNEPRTDQKAFDAIISETKNQLKFITGNPQVIFLDTLIKIMYQNDPRMVAIPNEEYLNAVDFQTAKNIYKDRFADASDFVFVFVGNIDTETMLPLMEKYIGSLPATGRKEFYKDVFNDLPKETSNTNIYVGMEDKGTIAIAFGEPYEWTMKNNYYIEIFKEVLSIRLIEVIREKMGGTYSPSLQLSGEKLPDSKYEGMIYINCDPKKIKKISKTVFAVMNEILNKGISEENYNKATEQIKKSLEINTKERNAYWRNYISEQYYNEDPLNEIDEYFKLLETVTKEEVSAAIKTMFNTKHYIGLYQYPEKKKK